MGGACTAAVADLQAAGLHYVVANASDKEPLKAGWLERAASAEEAAAARSEPYLLLGHVPHRAGLLVVDIDTDRGRPVWWWREAVEESLGPPLCAVRTGSGGLHLYYRCDRPVGNRKWEGGEIRCAAGHAVLWDEDAVLGALEDLSEAEPVDVSRWPIHQIAEPGRRPHKPRPGQTARVRSALRSLPCAELDYDDWLYVGMALQWGEHYGCVDDGLALWRGWSETDPARYKFGECAAKWRGFDPDGGRTLGTLFWLAKRHGWKGWRGPRLSKPKVDGWDHPHLNKRQFETHSILSAIAKPGKGGRLTVCVLQQTLADHHRRCRKTITRDIAQMERCGYLRRVGRKTIREQNGGFVVPVYRPTDPDRERWLRHARDKGRRAERQGPVAYMAGGVWDILPPIPGVGSGRSVLRRWVDSTTEPEEPP